MDIFTWIAELQDTTCLIEGQSPFSQVMEENKKGNLSRFMLVPTDPSMKRAVVTLNDKRKLIFYRKTLNHLASYGQFSWKIHVIGWEENVKGVSRKVQLFVFPGGEIELNTDESSMEMDYHNKLIELFKKTNSIPSN